MTKFTKSANVTDNMKHIVIAFLTALVTLALLIGAIFFYRFVIMDDSDTPVAIVEDSASDETIDNLDESIPEYDDESEEITGDDFEVDDDVLVSDDFNEKDFVPPNATNVEVLELDLEDDGVDEYAVKYTRDDIVVDSREYTKTFVYVYKWSGKEWSVIKEDQVSEKGGVVERKFSRFEVIDFYDFNSGHEMLFVSKEIVGDYIAGYYVFGEQKDGSLGDHSIPKGYLHEDDYLKETELFLNFYKLEVNDTGLVEKYSVACEAYFEGSEVDRKPCRYFDLHVTFFTDKYFISCLYQCNID